MNSDDMRTILGVIGNVTSFLKFISLLPRIWETWKYKEELIYDYHIPAYRVIWCIMWVLYSMPFVHPNSILVTTSNCVGAFICIIYHIIFFLIFKKARRSMVAEYIVEFVFLDGLTWITLAAFDSHSTRSGFVGFFCDLFGIIGSFSELACTIDNVVGAVVGFILLLLFAGYYCVDRFRTIKLSPIDDC
uniref:Uncharacterized protein n=1 Tax=Chenopodium quinoa TaxID=63459 RepID=A0A803LJ56_CHEQI